MIRIKPEIDFQGLCPRCAGVLAAEKLLWQGIHVCVAAHCQGCGAEIIGDLPIGHAINTPYQIDLEEGRLWGDARSRHWFGAPFLASLRAPDRTAVGFQIEKFRAASQVVILNCIDHLYGHVLLKLLNVQAILEARPDLGLVVIVPRLLRWMVPAGVAEIWTVDVPLSKAQAYYPLLDDRIAEECLRFEEIWLSSAHCHPANFDITRFSGIARHDFSREEYRITFIWREDRPWLQSRLAVRVARRTGLMGGLLAWQNLKVRRFFSRLRRRFPGAKFTVAGLGTRTLFPAWIEDHRVARFTDEEERKVCDVYAQSRLVVGVHGSNMLLPSGHAGMTIDLMPADRWPNFAQDILYQESDTRVASFRYRYLPLGVPVPELARIAGAQIEGGEVFELRMRAHGNRSRPSKRNN